MMALQIFAFACILLAPLAHAVPSIAFPLNSQVPPVARASTPFSYTFSPSTFFSTLPLTYTLSSGPSWLLLDGPARTLHGTPSEKDANAVGVTGVPIGITATDSSGSKLLNSTLVVTTNEAPLLKISPDLQLPSFGLFSFPSTVLYHPSSTFNMKFDTNTFSGSGLRYYAVASDNTPLPTWINFDNSSLTFSGRTPDPVALTQPPQTFGIQLIASDVEGFAGTSMFFNIVVGLHLLTIAKERLVIEAVVGEEINFTGLGKAIQIDGVQAERRELASVVASTPNWLAFDSSSLAFTGTVPNDAMSLNITVFVTDIYKDTISTSILIDIVLAPFFKKPVADLNATIGSVFTYDLGEYLNQNSDFEISTNFTPAESWISFDPKTFILSGEVPKTASPMEIVVNLNARSRSSKAIGSQHFKIVVRKANAVVSSSATPSATHTNPKPTPTTLSVAQTKQKALSKTVIIAIVVPLGILFLAILFALLYQCRRRRRLNNSKHPLPLSKSDISLPREKHQSIFVSTTVSSIHGTANPEQLQRDISEFGHPNTTLVPNSPSPSSTRKKVLRRSRTSSQNVNIGAGGRGNPDISTNFNLGSSHSDDASKINMSPNPQPDLSKGLAPGSWSSTPESFYSPIQPLQVVPSQPLSQNYSRKGYALHQLSSCRDLPLSNIDVLQESTINIPAPTLTRPETSHSGLNVQDGNCSPPLPILPPSQSQSRMHSKTKSITAQTIERLRRPRSASRYSRYVPSFASSTSGMGHGSGRRDSMSSHSYSLSGGEGTNQRSIGHGQGHDWFFSNEQEIGSSFSNWSERDERNWLDIGLASSNSSHHHPYTQPTEKNGHSTNHQQQQTIRLVRKSPPPSFFSRSPTFSSSSHRSSKHSSDGRVGKRTSPFSLTTPNKRYSPLTTSSLHPPISPISLSETIMLTLRQMNLDHAPYSTNPNIRRSTMQIRRSIESLSPSEAGERESRFDSARTSLLDFPLPPGSGMPSEGGGSWETSYSHSHSHSDGSGSFMGGKIRYAENDTPEINMAIASLARGRGSLVDRNSRVAAVAGGGLGYHYPIGNGIEEMMSGGVRMVPGMAMIPVGVGVDFGDRKRSSKVLVEEEAEGEYKVYI